MSWVTASIFGETLPYIEFFQPNGRFADAVKRFHGKQVFDVGCGAGAATFSMRLSGLNVCPMDICYREGSDIDVVIADGTSFPYDLDSVVMVCRPCHGYFCMDVLDQAIRCGCSYFVYVGKQENIEIDIDDLVLSDSSRVDKIEEVGRDGEVMLVIDLNEMSISW